MEDKFYFANKDNLYEVYIDDTLSAEEMFNLDDEDILPADEVETLMINVYEINDETKDENHYPEVQDVDWQPICTNRQSVVVVGKELIGDNPEYYGTFDDVLDAFKQVANDDLDHDFTVDYGAYTGHGETLLISRDGILLAEEPCRDFMERIASEDPDYSEKLELCKGFALSALPMSVEYTAEQLLELSNRIANTVDYELDKNRSMYQDYYYSYDGDEL